MNIEELIEYLKNYKYDNEVRQAIETLLTAYEKEKETSHYIQSQLDIANAKLVEEKEKNKELISQIDEHVYNGCDYELCNKKWKDKIKAKIEEIDIEIQCCEYADDDTEEYKQDIEKEKRRLLRDKAVLQSLLEKE